MFSKRWIQVLAKASSALALLLSLVPASLAQATLGQPCCSQPQCATGCCNVFNCPKPYKYCQEGPPCICIICACPKPVCCPCDAPNWGYFQTCWRPNPWGANFSHCYGVPPAAQIMAPLSNPGVMHGVPLLPATDLPSNLPRSTGAQVPAQRPGL